MATDEEYAEAQRLINEINHLQLAISQARAEQISLENELNFVIGALGVLTAHAGEMSEVVTSDVNALVARVASEELEARDLLQELRDLSERYFTYKNLSTATKNATRYTDEYHTRFASYRGLRRISLGAVMAVDNNIIHHETARETVERAYLANTDYWLAYAMMAVMLWWADEREAAERARSKALLMDERKSSLFFLFCNLKFGRKEAAARWYDHYLGTIHANDVGEEYQYLLEAYLSGAFGSDPKLSASVSSRLEDMLSEVTLYNINYNREVSEAASRSLSTMAQGTDFPFFYLAEYSPNCDEMRNTLESAERCLVLAQNLELLAEQDTDYGGVDEQLEESIYHIIESMDTEEEKVWRRIKLNELIVAARGNVNQAQLAYTERYPEKTAVGLGSLMQRWALTENDPRILPEVRRFAIKRLSEPIRAGYTSYAEGYRATERERYEIHVDEWSFSANENEISIAQQNYSAHFEKNQLKDYLKDRLIQTWLVMIVAGLVGIAVAAATTRNEGAIVSCVLLVLAGGFLLWRQIAEVQRIREIHYQKSMEIIEKTLTEMSSWRNEYHHADEGFEELMQAITMIEEG